MFTFYALRLAPRRQALRALEGIKDDLSGPTYDSGKGSPQRPTSEDAEMQEQVAAGICVCGGRVSCSACSISCFTHYRIFTAWFAEWNISRAALCRNNTPGTGYTATVLRHYIAAYPRFAVLTAPRRPNTEYQVYPITLSIKTCLLRSIHQTLFQVLYHLLLDYIPSDGEHSNHCCVLNV